LCDWEDVIVVGGTDPGDDRTSCSAYGLAVDLYAPGIDILSAYINGGLGLSGCGTSASTPIAAGIAGLGWSANPCLAPQEVELRLLSGCVDLAAPGNDTIWGWGRVDSFGAVLGASSCGDCDGDGSVDTDDWLTLATCLAGPDQPMPADCWCADLGRDGDVDLADFAAFQLLIPE
jgi:subtilisin family serine protease